MAVVMEQHQNFKHFCRICKKGFVCGRALGGHMRAHGIGDDVGPVYEDDSAGDWDDKLGGNSGNKRMYALRTNPNRLKSCRICKNCGKEFLSWKLFLEHGKCSSEDVESSLVSSPGSEEEDGSGRRDCPGWSKGKRSRRVAMLGNSNSNCPSMEEEELANCLVMLSAARVDPMVVEAEESCTSASKEEEQQKHRNYASIEADVVRLQAEKPKGIGRGMFECKACKKVFNSHQALGGHRASHKKVKGCFAAKLEELDESMVEEDVITHEEFSCAGASSRAARLDQAVPDLSFEKPKQKVHECSICHRVFASGQALGGHKRCHWVTSNSPDPAIAKFHQLQEQRPKFDASDLPLDLNLPAPSDDAPKVRPDNVAPLSLEFPTALYLQQWIGIQSNTNNNNSNKNNNSSSSNNKKNNHSEIYLDDEADSKIKLAKLSDLKDMSLGGASTPWLQVGIGSATNESGNP